MRKLRSTITRSLIATVVVAIGLALAPATAAADPVVFTVVETVVPGATPNSFDADKITSSYTESLTINPDGTFTASLIVTFNGYDLAGVPQAHQVGPNSPAGEALDPGDYGLYALVTATGNVQSAADPNDANQTVFDFDPITATATVFINPDQAAGGDSQILTATTINALASDGSVTTVTATGQVVGGTFTIVFTNAMTEGLGLTYFPDFTGLVLTAVSTGDVDETSIVGPGGGAITGEASINFEAQQVPEPASMTLFGIGLLGAGFAARRRRNRTAA